MCSVGDFTDLSDNARHLFPRPDLLHLRHSGGIVFQVDIHWTFVTRYLAEEYHKTQFIVIDLLLGDLR